MIKRGALVVVFLFLLPVAFAQTALNPVEDVYVYEAEPTLSKWGDPFLYVGKDANGKETITFAKFNAAGSLSRTRLTLTPAPSDVSAAGTEIIIDVYALSAPFNERTTWSNRPSLGAATPDYTLRGNEPLIIELPASIYQNMPYGIAVKAENAGSGTVRRILLTLDVWTGAGGSSGRPPPAETPPVVQPPPPPPANECANAGGQGSNTGVTGCYVRTTCAEQNRVPIPSGDAYCTRNYIVPNTPHICCGSCVSGFTDVNGKCIVGGTAPGATVGRTRAVTTPTCTLTEAYWSTTQENPAGDVTADEGGPINLVVKGTDCNGKNMEFTLHNNDDLAAALFSFRKTATFGSDGVASVDWGPTQTISGALSDYNFKAKVVVAAADTTAPTLASVSSDGQTYSTAGAQAITITFSEDISNTPTITIDSASQPVTDCGDTDAKTFCFAYTVPVNVNEQKTIAVSGAQDTATPPNPMVADSSHKFNVNTIADSPPTVSSVDSDGKTFTTAGPQAIRVTFNEDISTAPTVSIDSAPQTVTNCNDADAKTFCFTYTVPPNTPAQQKTIVISGAKDAANNAMASDSTHKFNVDTVVADTQAPVLAEVTPVPTPTADNTPSYTFTSNEAGTITYSGGCTSSTTNAAAGANTVTFNTLADGTYSDCVITVTDAAGNAGTLTIRAFTVSTVVAPPPSYPTPHISDASKTFRQTNIDVSAGDAIIAACGAENVYCGLARITNNGNRYIITVFADDGQTAEKDGARAGDTISFYKNSRLTADNKNVDAATGTLLGTASWDATGTVIPIQPAES